MLIEYINPEQQCQYLLLMRFVKKSSHHFEGHQLFVQRAKTCNAKCSNIHYKINMLLTHFINDTLALLIQCNTIQTYSHIIAFDVFAIMYLYLTMYLSSKDKQSNTHGESLDIKQLNVSNLSHTVNYFKFLRD